MSGLHLIKAIVLAATPKIGAAKARQAQSETQLTGVENMHIESAAILPIGLAGLLELIQKLPVKRIARLHLRGGPHMFQGRHAAAYAQIGQCAQIIPAGAAIRVRHAV